MPVQRDTVGIRGGEVWCMTGLRSGALRQLALMFIAREAGSDVDAAAIAAAARRAYEALVRVLTPLIGAMGVVRLIRAVRTRKPRRRT